MMDHTHPGAAPQDATDRERVERWIRAFQGEYVPVDATAEDWARAAHDVVGALLDAESWPGVEGSPRLLLDDIAHRTLAPGADTRREAIARAMLRRLEPRSGVNDRIFLLRALAIIGGAESVPRLKNMLGDAQVGIREYALRALESNPADAAGKVLIVALKRDIQDPGRLAIANALGARREEAAVPMLAEKLQVEESPKVARAMRDALGNIGSLAAARAMRDGVDGDALRSRLLEAERLRERGEPRATALLEAIHSAAREPLLRLAALRGLVLADPARAVPRLVETLRGGDEATRVEASRLVLELRDADAGALAEFERAIAELPESVRAMVREALGEKPVP